MNAKGMRRSAVRLLAFAVAFGVVVTGAILVANRVSPGRSPGDVHIVIDAYLADVDAAREEYRDTVVTATGVVAWSARDDEITSRAVDTVIEKSDRATVLFFVDDRHRIHAHFDPQNQLEALALKMGDRVTITGRHRGGFFTGNVWHGKVILILEGCEFVR